MINFSNQLSPEAVVTAFHTLYYNIGWAQRGTWTSTSWMGTATEKLPLDLWIYQELIHKLRPQLIIETGTRHGGSALFLSHMCDLTGDGAVVTVDIETPAKPPIHPRLTYLKGSSTSEPILTEVRHRAQGLERVLVILDSDHSEPHVTREMNAYYSLVTPGSYLIVEDSNLNGHPIQPNHGPGPMESITKFLPAHPEFEIDTECEKFLLTFNPRGFLKRRIG